MPPPVERRIVVQRAGWRRWVPDKTAPGGGAWAFYILPSVFKGEVVMGLDARLVARAMAARGMIVPGPAGKYQVKARPPGRPSM